MKLDSGFIRDESTWIRRPQPDSPMGGLGSSPLMLGALGSSLLMPLTGAGSMSSHSEEKVPNSLTDRQRQSGLSEASEQTDGLSSVKECSDGELLYQTLAHDGALPDGLLPSLSPFSTALGASATSNIRTLPSMSNPSAVLWLHQHRQAKKQEEKNVKQASDQFLLAIGDRPRKYRTRLERTLFDGLTAQRNAADAQVTVREVWTS